MAGGGGGIGARADAARNEMEGLTLASMLHLPTVLQLYAQCTSHNQFLFFFSYFYVLQVAADWLVGS